MSYDVNYRSRLWKPAAARAATEAMLRYVDLLLVGDEVARALWGWDDDTCLDRLADAGPVRSCSSTARAAARPVVDGERLTSPGFPACQLDPIGAGDALAAGYLAATLWNLDPPDAGVNVAAVTPFRDDERFGIPPAPERVASPRTP